MGADTTTASSSTAAWNTTTAASHARIEAASAPRQLPSTDTIFYVILGVLCLILLLLVTQFSMGLWRRRGRRRRRSSGAGFWRGRAGSASATGATREWPDKSDFNAGAGASVEKTLTLALPDRDYIVPQERLLLRVTVHAAAVNSERLGPGARALDVRLQDLAFAPSAGEGREEQYLPLRKMHRSPSVPVTAAAAAAAAAAAVSASAVGVAAAAAVSTSRLDVQEGTYLNPRSVRNRLISE